MLLIDKLKNAKKNVKESPKFESTFSRFEDQVKNNTTRVVDLTDPILDNTTTTVAPTFSKSTATTAPEFSEPSTTENKSNVKYFLEKYSEGDVGIQALRYDLAKLVSDVNWIKESGYQNEQFCLDFMDALNEISVTF